MRGGGIRRTPGRFPERLCRRNGLFGQVDDGKPLATRAALHYPGWEMPSPTEAGSDMTRYRWAAWGDVNAFFGLMLDNVAVMVFLVSTISSSTPPEAQQGRYTFTSQFVLTHMIPGTALGVLIGD